MLIIKIKGGLGNQLFQYAFGQYLAEKVDTKLYLDIQHYKKTKDDYAQKNRIYSLENFNCRLNYASPEQVKALTNVVNEDDPLFISFFRKCKNYFHLLPSTHYLDSKKFGKIVLPETHLKRANNDCYFEGNWQNYRYIEPIKDLLKKEFTFKSPATGKNKETLQLIQGCDSVSVHIRRGDYAKYPQYQILPMEYYQVAIDYIKNTIKSPVFFVFTDEPEIKQNWPFSGDFHFITHNTQATALEDLRLMSHCKANIIANSTFSWWGGWLNQNPEKLVIYPHMWKKKREQNLTTVPEWVCL